MQILPEINIYLIIIKVYPKESNQDVYRFFKKF